MSSRERSSKKDRAPLQGLHDIEDLKGSLETDDHKEVLLSQKKKKNFKRSHDVINPHQTFLEQEILKKLLSKEDISKRTF